MKKLQAGGIIRTSLDNTWQTPESILDRVRAFFGGPIPFDPATAPSNPTRADRFCAGPAGTMFAGDSLESKNGLEVSWDWPWFVNPPYGTELAAWFQKITQEAERLSLGVALLPCNRWETHLQRVLGRANAVCFHKGRVSFVSSIDGAAVGGNPYASMLLGFNVSHRQFRDAFAPLGRCLGLEQLGGVS